MNTAKETVSCKIEHHAMMFAFLAKRAIETCGEEGKQAILDGMTSMVNERGARMAARAIAHGDPLNTMTNRLTASGSLTMTDRCNLVHSVPNRHFRLIFRNVPGVKHGKSTILQNTVNFIVSMLIMRFIRDSALILSVPQLLHP